MSKNGTEIPPPLPGRCVEIPNVKAKVRSQDGSMEFEVETHVVPDLDVDGYGSPVVLVPDDSPDQVADNMTWTMYLKRGDCGYDIGTITGLDDPASLESESNGFRDLSTVRAAARPTGRGRGRGNVVSTEYKFDGKRYYAGKGRRR
jgi:hypothetical protein